MSQPFNVDPGQVGDAGAAWDGLLPDFDAAAPNVSGGWPTHAAAQGAVASAKASTGRLQQGVGQTAGTAQQAASQYQNQEKQSAWSLKDGTGPMSDIASLFGTVAGAIVPFATEAESFAGQMLSTGISGGLQVVQQVTTAVNHTGGQTGGAPIAGIGLPPADQTSHTPDVHTAASAAPAAEDTQAPEHAAGKEGTR